MHRYLHFKESFGRQNPGPNTNSVNNSTLEILAETRGVEGAYEAGSDGFLLGSLDSGSSDPEAVAATSAIAANTSERIGIGLGLGNLKCILLEFRNGKVIIAKEEHEICVVVGNKHVVFGDILLKLQRLKKK
jgi:predicted regulator of Ras-like GTPase activity (Roadblock/LC7/MglB family)